MISANKSSATLKYAIYTDQKVVRELEKEVISVELRVHLTRLLEKKLKERKSDHHIIFMNSLINASRSLIGKTIWVLEPGEMGYEDEEYAWHYGEFHLLFRRLSTPQLAEYLCDLIDQSWFTAEELNELMKQEGASFRFFQTPNQPGVELLDIKILEEMEEENANAHPNIRLLIKRMEAALDSRDVSGVLHASASIFETLAKDIVPLQSIQNQTLKSFFDRYRKDSKLPPKLLDYILEIYDARNTEPLAGHGSTARPRLTLSQATVLAEMTKAFVRIEYTLNLQERPPD